VVNSDGDGLGGLIVDRYGETLAVSVHSLGLWRRLDSIIARLHSILGAKRAVLKGDEKAAAFEQIDLSEPRQSLTRVGKQSITEHCIRHEIDFGSAHKTGFFCDQRENRRKLGQLITANDSVLDLRAREEAADEARKRHRSEEV
jgi:23S rRNA (cytosine1962-C5)-methyltransferase